MALTHRAARIARGETIAHCLKPHIYGQDAWAIVDECSQIPLDTLRHGSLVFDGLEVYIYRRR